ncbi:MAG TPA: hypothetical protein VEA69_21740 [Tepidisphaeraceae bacterium]|nr:hypothetical protein [Tepidisphaeraceae bacterium]
MAIGKRLRTGTDGVCAGAVSRRAGVLSLAVAGLAAPWARAAGNYTWTASGTVNWSSSSAWGGTLPVSAPDTTLQFKGTGSYTATNNVADPFDVSLLWLQGAATTKTLAGSAIQFNNATEFGGLSINSSAGTWNVNTDLRLAVDTYLTAGTGTNVTINGRFGGPGKLLVKGSSSLVLAGNGHTHAGTDIVNGSLTIGSNGNLGAGPVRLLPGLGNPRLVVPGAANLVSGDGSVFVGEAASIEFGTVSAAAVAKLDRTSNGLLALTPTTVFSGTLDLSAAPDLRIGVSDVAVGGGVTLSAAIVPGGSTYRFGGTTQGGDLLGGDVLTVSTALTDGPGGSVRSVNVGQSWAQSGGRVRLTNMGNTYSGGTLVERSTSGSLWLSIDRAYTAADRPFGTGALTVDGAVSIEGAAGSVAGLATPIVLKPGSRVVLNNVGGTSASPTSQVADRWGDAQPLALNGTTVELRTVGSGTVTETVGATTYADGSTILLGHSDSGAAGTDVLAMASLTREGRGTLMIDSRRVTPGASTRQSRAAALGAGMVDAATGMVHPSVILGDSWNESYHFAKVDWSGNLVKMPTVGPYNSASDSEVVDGPSVTFADETVWAMKMFGTHTISPGATLTIRSGGLNLIATTLKGGALSFADNGTPVEGIVFVARDEVISTPLTARAGLTVSGAALSSLTLSGTNDIAGPLTVYTTLTPGSAGAIPDGLPVHLGEGGTLVLSGRDLTVSSLTGVGRVDGSAVGSSTFTVDAATDCEFGGTIVDRTVSGRLLTLVKRGPGTLTLSGWNRTIGTETSDPAIYRVGGYLGPTHVQEGTLVLAERFRQYGAYRTDGGAALVFETDHAITSLDGEGSTTVRGGAVVTTGRVRQGALTVTEGAVVRVRAGGGEDGVSRVGTLNVTGGGALDLADGAMVIDYEGSPAGLTQTVHELLASGYASGAWTGPGVRSSSAATTSDGRRYALGYGEAAIMLGLADDGSTATWLGQTVDATTLLVRYTLAGDADLNGTVALNDLVVLANHYGNATGQTWSDGDFDYDGKIALNDLVILANQYGSSLGAADWPAGDFAADWALAQDLAAGGATSVPEPGAVVGVIGLAVAAMCGGRGRGRRA